MCVRPITPIGYVDVRVVAEVRSHRLALILAN
jgi:hypothetical protein